MENEYDYKNILDITDAENNNNMCYNTIEKKIGYEENNVHQKKEVDKIYDIDL